MPTVFEKALYADQVFHQKTSTRSANIKMFFFVW